jgi:hypothetical protein
MEMVLNNGFCEMSLNEMEMVEGGGFWSTVVDGVSNFLVNRLIWTNAKIMYENFYVPITPAGAGGIIYA